jgi:hypothetical protein
MHFRVLQEVPYKGEIQLYDTGCEPCIYIKQITIKKVCTLNFTLFKTKYIGLSIRFYQQSVRVLPLAEFKCPAAHIGVLRHFDHTHQCTDQFIRMLKINLSFMYLYSHINKIRLTAAKTVLYVCMCKGWA